MRSWWLVLSAFFGALLCAPRALAGEGDIVLPKFSEVTIQGIAGSTFLAGGIGIAVVGLIIGFIMFNQVKNLPVHKAMLDISELIYATCFTYVVTQAKFIAKLWGLIAIVVIAYFGVLSPAAEEMGPRVLYVGIILVYSIIGI